MTYANHRATENTEDAQRYRVTRPGLVEGSRPRPGHATLRASSVTSVSPWLTFVISLSEVLDADDRSDVLVRTLKRRGVVVEMLKAGVYRVQVGAMTITAGEKDLEAPAPSKKKKGRQT